MSEFSVFAALLLIIALVVGIYMIAQAIGGIMDNQATIAREQTAQVEAKQQYATERFEAFLATLRSFAGPVAQPISPIVAYLAGCATPIVLATWLNKRKSS